MDSFDIRNNVLYKVFASSREITIPNEVLETICSNDMEKGERPCIEVKYKNRIRTINFGSRIQNISICLYKYCFNLEYINVDVNNMHYTSIDGVLYDKYVKTLLHYPANKKGKELILPSSVIRLFDSSFFYNRHLEKVVIPNHVRIIDDFAFEESELLKEIILHDGNLEICHGAFGWCRKLEGVIKIPFNIKKLHTMFIGCGKLEEVILPEGLEEIGTDTFSGCSNLRKLVIPSNVKKIGGQAFLECESLEKIIIPRSVEEINSEAFDGCKNLTIYCEVDKKPKTWHKEWNSSRCKVIWGYKG